MWPGAQIKWPGYNNCAKQISAPKLFCPTTEIPLDLNQHFSWGGGAYISFILVELGGPTLVPKELLSTILWQATYIFYLTLWLKSQAAYHYYGCNPIQLDPLPCARKANMHWGCQKKVLAKRVSVVYPRVKGIHSLHEFKQPDQDLHHAAGKPLACTSLAAIVT